MKEERERERERERNKRNLWEAAAIFCIFINRVRKINREMLSNLWLFLSLSLSLSFCFSLCLCVHVDINCRSNQQKPPLSGECKARVTNDVEISVTRGNEDPGPRCRGIKCNRRERMREAVWNGKKPYRDLAYGCTGSGGSLVPWARRRDVRT